MHEVSFYLSWKIWGPWQVILMPGIFFSISLSFSTYLLSSLQNFLSVNVDQESWVLTTNMTLKRRCHEKRKVHSLSPFPFCNIPWMPSLLTEFCFFPVVLLHPAVLSLPSPSCSHCSDCTVCLSFIGTCPLLGRETDMKVKRWLLEEFHLPPGLILAPWYNDVVQFLVTSGGFFFFFRYLISSGDNFVSLKVQYFFSTKKVHLPTLVL